MNISPAGDSATYRAERELHPRRGISKFVVVLPWPADWLSAGRSFALMPYRAIALSRYRAIALARLALPAGQRRRTAASKI